jgi:hypothetical protein
MPHIVPPGWSYNPELDVIGIGTGISPGAGSSQRAAQPERRLGD